MTTAAITLPAQKYDVNTVFVRPENPPARATLDQLAPLPGFNTRVRDADYSARVGSLAESMEQHGFYEHKPLAVVMLENDPTIYFYDGEHRYDAAKIATLNGVDFGEGLPVVFAPADVTVLDLTVSLMRGNDGAQMNSVEQATIVQRMLDYGVDKVEIARQIGRTVRHVENLIVLAGSNATVKKAVAGGQIAAAEAVKMVRKDGTKAAAEKITAAVKAAAEKGKVKATPKTMADTAAGPKMKRVPISISLSTGDSMGDVLKAFAKLVRETVQTDDSDKLTEDGSISATLHVIDHEAAAAAKAKAEQKIADDAERQTRMAARDAERAAAKKVREAEKAAAQKAKDKKAADAEKAKKKAEAEKAKAAAAAAKAKPAAGSTEKPKRSRTKAAEGVKAAEAAKTVPADQKPAQAGEPPVATEIAASEAESPVAPENGLADDNNGL